MIKGELTTEGGGTGKWKYSATFRTDKYGTYYGFGKTEKQAIADVERQANEIKSLRG